MEKPRILIVGTVPYSEKATSRAFAAYFTGWPREKLAQIFSSTKTPPKGHCGTLYQITDQRLLKARIHRTMEVGTIFSYPNLPEEWMDNSREVDSRLICKLYNLGRKKRPATMLLRRWLWNPKYWCSAELNRWLDAFRPECVFLSLSNDFFIQDIAMYAAQRYGIPMVVSIGDDYYFNDQTSWSPLYHWYKRAYRASLDQVFARARRAVYISDKIRDKYVAEFGLAGETVYLTSQVERRPFRPVGNPPVISYFGNLKMGRNHSLDDIGRALRAIHPRYCLDVYSNEQDPAYYRVLEGNPNIRFHGSVPYGEVKQRMTESDLVVIVEGFRPEDVAWSRYSLSTKAADALACGAQILAYGSKECGVIEYMEATRAAAVCTRREDLPACIRHLLEDEAFQRRCYEQAVWVSAQHHTLARSTALFEKLVKEAMEDV